MLEEVDVVTIFDARAGICARFIRTDGPDGDRRTSRMDRRTVRVATVAQSGWVVSNWCNRQIIVHGDKQDCFHCSVTCATGRGTWRHLEPMHTRRHGVWVGWSTPAHSKLAPKFVDTLVTWPDS